MFSVYRLFACMYFVSSLFFSVFASAETSPRVSQKTSYEASYDLSWYRTDFWPGEYPAGISVYEKGVIVLGREKLDKKTLAGVQCELPYLAVYQEWNVERNKKDEVQYVTYTQITKMVAKQDFTYPVDPSEGRPLKIKKGDTVEFLAYLSEGNFLMRFKGKVYTGEMSILERLEDANGVSEYQYDMWFRVKCTSGKRAWVLYQDIVKANTETGTNEYPRGLTGSSFEGYGESRDLTEEEAAQLRNETP